jgi:hypothetical protein
MLARRNLALLLAWPLLSPLLARADDAVKYVEDNGVTYRVATHTVHRPVCETHYEDRQQTVYAEQVQTQFLPSQRTSYVPTVEYVTEPYVANRWNPFGQPYLAYRTVPRMRWEARTEAVQLPVVQRQVVPQQQTVKVPVTTQRFVDEEQTSKVAVAVKPGDPLGGSSSIATRSPAGGTSLDTDPPRGGTAWRPADPAQSGLR